MDEQVDLYDNEEEERKEQDDIRVSAMADAPPDAEEDDSFVADDTETEEEALQRVRMEMMGTQLSQMNKAEDTRAVDETPVMVPLKIIETELKDFVDQYPIKDYDYCPCMLAQTQDAHARAIATSSNNWGELNRVIQENVGVMGTKQLMYHMQRIHHDTIKDHATRTVTTSVWNKKRNAFVNQVTQETYSTSDWSGRQMFAHLRGEHRFNKTIAQHQCIEMMKKFTMHIGNSIITVDSTGQMPMQIDKDKAKIFITSMKQLYEMLKTAPTSVDPLMGIS